MGIILGALAGAGGALQNRAKQWDEEDMATLRSNLDQAKQIAIEKAKSEMVDANRTKMVGAIGAEAKGIVAGKMAGNQVEDQATWTPEQEAARNQGLVQMAQDPRTRAQAAAKAGYVDEAAKLDKINENSAATVPWGSTRVDSEGNVIYDNGSALKGSINQQRADTKAAGGTKIDRYEDKHWDAGFGKMDKSAVSLTNAMGELEKTTHPELKNVWRSTYNSLRAAGEIGPDEAVAEADDIANLVKRKAEQRVAMALEADKKSTLTVDKAIQDIVKEKQAAERKMGQPPAAAPTPAKTSPTPAKAEPTPAEKQPVVQPPKKASKSTIPGAPAREDDEQNGFESTIKPALAGMGLGPDTPEFAAYLKNKIRLHQTLTSSESAIAKKLNLL